MGGSAWEYIVPYQPDIGIALDRLRQDVYDRGDYHSEAPEHRYAETTEEELRARLNPDLWHSGINDAILADWRDAQQRPTPVDPDTLVAAQPHSGTHSIIDMSDGVAAEPTMFTVSPLTDDELVELVGTTTPTLDQVRNRIWTAGRDSWVGTYVVCYLDARPHQIYFFGVSGD